MSAPKSVLITSFKNIVCGIVQGCLRVFKENMRLNCLKNIVISEIFQVRTREKLTLLKSPEVAQPFAIFILLTVVDEFSGTAILRAYVVHIFNTIFTDSATVHGKSLLFMTIRCKTCPRFLQLY